MEIKNNFIYIILIKYLFQDLAPLNSTELLSSFGYDYSNLTQYLIFLVVHL